MQKTILSFSVIIALAAIATTQVVLHNTAFATNATTAVVKGNNGTLKVHEIGTPTAFEDNDPKVCSFNFEGFGFDASQSGYIVLTTQGKSTPIGTNAGPFSVGPASNTGYFISQSFNSTSGSVTIKNGTYKATLYGKDTANNTVNYKDIKAKSKVFKVTCEAVTSPGTTKPTPSTPSTNTPDTGGKGSATSVPATRTSVSNELPTSIPATGASLLGIAAMLVSAVAAYVTTYIRQPKQLL